MGLIKRQSPPAMLLVKLRWTKNCLLRQAHPQNYADSNISNDLLGYIGNADIAKPFAIFLLAMFTLSVIRYMHRESVGRNSRANEGTRSWQHMQIACKHTVKKQTYVKERSRWC